MPHPQIGATVTLSPTLKPLVSFPSSTIGFTLQYRASEDCTVAGAWTDVGAKGSGVAWRLFDEAAIGDSTVQVNNISTSDASAEGYYSEINPSANNPNDVLVNESSEWDWPIENYSAANNTTYCFRKDFGIFLIRIGGNIIYPIII